jgi:hypothetical protein
LRYPGKELSFLNMKIVLLLTLIVGALLQFGCAANPNEAPAMRNKEEERRAFKQQEEFARSLPTPAP